MVAAVFLWVALSDFTRYTLFEIDMRLINEFCRSTRLRVDE
jgi:hypothetical protein